MSLRSYLQFRSNTSHSNTLVIVRNLRAVREVVTALVHSAWSGSLISSISTGITTKYGATLKVVPWVSEEAFLRQVQESDLSFAHVVVYNPERYILPDYVTDMMRLWQEDETTKIMRVNE